MAYSSAAGFTFPTVQRVFSTEWERRSIGTVISIYQTALTLKSCVNWPNDRTSIHFVHYPVSGMSSDFRNIFFFSPFFVCFLLFANFIGTRGTTSSYFTCLFTEFFAEFIPLQMMKCVYLRIFVIGLNSFISWLFGFSWLSATQRRERTRSRSQSRPRMWERSPLALRLKPLCFPNPFELGKYFWR